MEKPRYPNMPPEFSETSLLGQLALLHGMRAEHRHILDALGTTYRARLGLTKPEIVSMQGAIVTSAVYSRRHLQAQFGRYPSDVPEWEIGVQFTVSKFSPHGRWCSDRLHSIVAIEEEDSLLPRQDVAVRFTDKEVAAVYGMVSELREARADGRLPNLSQDLTDIVLHES